MLNGFKYSKIFFWLRCFGCLLIYTLGFAFRWRQIAMFAPIVPIIGFICALFLAPESPVFLLTKKRYASKKVSTTLFILKGKNWRRIPPESYNMF